VGVGVIVMVVIFTAQEIRLVCSVIMLPDFALMHWTTPVKAGPVVFDVFHLPSQALQSCLALLMLFFCSS
jgi:hypothetical protein